MTGAYESISLLLLTRLLAWETVGNTHTGASFWGQSMVVCFNSAQAALSYPVS